MVCWEHWRGIEKSLRVGLTRVPAKGLALAHLDQLSPLHDGDAVGEVAHDGHGMRDEQIRQLKLPLELFKQVDDLRAHADVESGDGLVGDDERGRRISARAIPMRWRWPPLNSCG